MSANGWIQYCPACAAESDPAVKASIQDTTEPEKFRDGLGVLDDHGNPLADNISIDDIDELQFEKFQSGELSSADDDDGD